MNKKQISYQFGRIFYNINNIICCAFTGIACFGAAEFFSDIKDLHDFYNIGHGIFYTLVGFVAGKSTVMGSYARFFLRKKAKQAKKNPEKYPFEHVNEIHIQDTEGLEKILQETRKNRFLEWGTCLKVAHNDGVATIYKILDPKIAKQRFLKGKSMVELKTDDERIKEEGYNGFHHYHPKFILPKFFQAYNFKVGYVDRAASLDAIELLSFNIPEGPEIIGFNKQHTYIPKNKEKTKLVRATPKEILAYLK